MAILACGHLACGHLACTCGHGDPIDREGNDHSDTEATNCRPADNGGTQSLSVIPSDMESIMTASTIPPSYVPSTVLSADDKESNITADFTESSPLSQQNKPDPAKKPVLTSESSFQYRSSKETNWRRLFNGQSVILGVMMWLIGIGLLILIHTIFSSQALYTRTNSTYTCQLLIFDSFLSDNFFANISHTREPLRFDSFLSGNYSNEYKDLFRY